VAGIERDSLLGAYRALFPTSVPLDFVHADHLKAADLAAYRLVVLPYPLMMPAAAAAELREYVRAGGALVVEARAGWNDERGRSSDTIPGLGLAEVVGAREADVQTVAKDTAVLRSDGDGLPGLAAGQALAGRWYEETLEPTAPAARVVARFASGGPAAVVSAFGRGRTLALGSYVAAAYVTHPDETGRRFFAGLLDWAGVERPVAVSGDPLEVRLLQSGPEHLAFVFNHSSTPVASTVSLRLPLAGRVTEDLVTGQPVAVSATADGFEWKGTLGPKSVRVIRVRRP
jgi:hypothetical protein